MAHVRFGDELEARLERLAQQTGRTKSFYVRKVVEDAIDDLEDLYIAQHRMENPGKRYSAKTVRESLGLDH